MGWGKFDDRYPSNRKIRPLSDAGFRLDVSAILWCSENLTDGFVPRDELHLASDVKHPVKAADELVRRGRWHLAGEGCDTETCPTGKPADGWQIHDYLDFNDTKEMVDARRAADRKRKRKPTVPDGTPPPGDGKGQPDSKRSPAGIPEESASESGTENERSPNGVQPSALPRGRTRAPAPRPVPSLTASGDDPTDLASVDAHDEREPDHGPAGALTALYAVGVPMTDHGRAHRTIAAALDHYDPDLVRRGVLQLIAEDRACTPDTLRIAIHAGDEPAAAQPGQQRRRTATEKADAWLTVGVEPHEQAPPLRAITGGAT